MESSLRSNASAMRKYSGDFTLPKYISVAESIRQDIETGKYKTGQQLPSERDLARSFKVAYLTIRQALSLLEQRDLIAREHGRGTFVRQKIIQALIGVLIGQSLMKEVNHFSRAIHNALIAEIEIHGWQSRAYDGFADIWGRSRSNDSPVHRRLEEDFRHLIFAGLIEFEPGENGIRLPNRARALPRSRFKTAATGTDMVLDRYHFACESVSFLARAGRKNIACFLGHGSLDKHEDEVRGMRDAVQRAVSPKPRTELFTYFSHPATAEHEVFKRMQAILRHRQILPASKRFDALLVADDIQMRAVALALIHADIHVPKDILVLSGANEGIDLHYGLPVVRYEISPREMARNLVDLLANRIHGHPDPILPIVIQGRIKQ